MSMNKILIGTMHIYSMHTLISCSSNVVQNNFTLSILGLGVRGSAKCHVTKLCVWHHFACMILCSKVIIFIYYPGRACASRSYVIRAGVHLYI